MESPILLNVKYNRIRKGQLTDTFEYVYMENGHPKYNIVPATAEIYFVKPEYRNFNHNKVQEEISKMNRVRVPIYKIPQAIADDIGPAGQELYRAMWDAPDYESRKKIMRKLFEWRYSFGADFIPEFYFMRDWYNRYPYVLPVLSKAYMDIEVETIDHDLDLDNLKNNAYGAVNLITVIFQKEMKSYTLALRPYEPNNLMLGRTSAFDERMELYKSQLKQHESLMAEKHKFIKELNDTFDKTYGNIEYDIIEFEHEIDLIAYAFKLINQYKPNFCLLWNMPFDIPYLIERTKILGYEPSSIMCHPDFESKDCYFTQDNVMEMEKQTVTFNLSSYTIFVCHMRLYASTRKSQSNIRSFSLNSIGDIELGERKVDFSKESNMTLMPFKNWKKFIIYNIKD